MLIPFSSFPILNRCFLECKNIRNPFLSEGSNFYCSQSGDNGLIGTLLWKKKCLNIMDIALSCILQNKFNPVSTLIC